MKVRKYLILPLLFLLSLPAAVKAQDKNVPPTFALRFNSIDSLLENVKFMANLAGQKDAVRSIEGLIKNQIGDKGLAGVDTARPVGAYGRVGAGFDVSGAVLVPIADENAFLALLKNLNIATIKDNDGIHTIKTPLQGFDAYLRFANKYAYFTALSKGPLEDKNLLDPAKILAGKPTTAFSLKIQLSQVPMDLKNITTAMAEQVLKEVETKDVPGESKAHKAFRAAALHEVAKIIGAVLKDGGELSVDVDINQKTGDVAASFSLAGVSGTELAAGIDSFAKNPSMFGGLLKKDAAFNGVGRLKLSDPLVKALDDVVEDARATLVTALNDTGKKQQFDAIFKAILPTFKTGDFDGALVITENAKKLTVLNAAKVKDGLALGQTVRSLLGDAIKDLPPALKDKIKLDMDAVGGVKIHKLELAALNPNAKILETYLGEANLYLAFRNDAMFLSAGLDGLQAIKAAIPVAPSGPTPMLFYEVDVARLAFLAPPEQIELAKKLFPGGQGGTVRLSVEGGSAMTLRLATKISVLHFLGSVHEMKMKGN